MGGASTDMAASRGKTDSAIVSGALENGGDGTMASVGGAVEGGHGVFGQGGGNIIGLGVGRGGGI